MKKKRNCEISILRCDTSYCVRLPPIPNTGHFYKLARGQSGSDKPQPQATTTTTSSPRWIWGRPTFCVCSASYCRPTRRIPFLSCRKKGRLIMNILQVVTKCGPPQPREERVRLRPFHLRLDWTIAPSSSSNFVQSANRLPSSSTLERHSETTIPTNSTGTDDSKDCSNHHDCNSTFLDAEDDSSLNPSLSLSVSIQRLG